MTTQATMRESKDGVRTLVGLTAATLMLLAGAALWLVRPGGEAPTPATRASTVPLVRPVEQSPEDHWANIAYETAPVTTMGDMAELYADQAAARAASDADLVFIAGSLDEATTIRALAEDFAAPAGGRVPTVVVADTPEAEPWTGELLAVVRGVRGALGLPTISVIEVRRPTGIANDDCATRVGPANC